MSRIRVTRTLVYEGEEEWVQATLARSYIQIGDETGGSGIGFRLVTPRGTIKESDRLLERVGVVG